jgi:hypothetical protein
VLLTLSDRSSRSLSADGRPEPDREAALHRLSLLSTMLTNGLTLGLGLEKGLLFVRGDSGMSTAGGALDANEEPLVVRLARLDDDDDALPNRLPLVEAEMVNPPLPLPFPLPAPKDDVPSEPKADPPVAAAAANGLILA